MKRFTVQAQVEINNHIGMTSVEVIVHDDKTVEVLSLESAGGQREPDSLSDAEYHHICEEALAALEITSEKLQDPEEAFVLQMCDNSPTPPSMMVMGILSDCQFMIKAGLTEQAIEALNTAKIIIDARLAKKDSHGRHCR
jgi:hypothetical protein